MVVRSLKVRIFRFWLSVTKVIFKLKDLLHTGYVFIF